MSGDSGNETTPVEVPSGPAALAPGASFAGYVIEGEAGRGGMGVVYRAREAIPARTVALKVISPDLAVDSAFRERFQRESQSAAAIEHSNVIPVYRVGDEDGLLFLAMRYVEGTTLEKVITTEGRVAPGRARDLFLQVAAALDAAHAHGLVHRDVKPANVLLAREGGREHVYLTDFGLATRHDTTSGLTSTGFFMGTLDYAAPEQIQAGRIDARTDIYAAGCMLYRALTGAVPFPRPTAVAKIYAHLTDTPPSVLDADPSLPPALDDVVRRAMAKDPDARFPSAGDLGAATAAAIDGSSPTRPERAVATGPAEYGVEETVPVERPLVGVIQPAVSTRSRTRLIGTFAVAAAIVMAAIAVALLRGRSEPNTSTRATAGLASRSTSTSATRKTTSTANAALEAATQVRACVSAHGLAEAHEKTTPTPESMVFSSCDWPPPAWADPDGFSRIRLKMEDGPGRRSGPNQPNDMSEAGGANRADYIDAPCERVELAYTYGSMGHFEHLRPFTVTRGTITWAGTPGQAWTGDAPYPYPGPNQIVYIRNNKQVLDTARCVQ